MEKNSVVQVTNYNHLLYGALLIVSDVKSWGVVADILDTSSSSADVFILPTRLKHEDIKLVGEAHITADDIINKR